MRIDENLYKAFLEEMDALENFRIAYASLHPGVPLDREDPDVRRLIEAMALFSARTRLAGCRNIISTRRRIFQQFFPYLLTPLPSMAILQAMPTAQISEALFFPKGSEITVSPESGGAAIFQTLNNLRILPISLSEFSNLLLSDKGFRLVLRFRAAFARSEEIGKISIFINHLNNYEASQLVLYNLKHHIKQASVVFDEKVYETTSGTPCNVSYGIESDDDDFSHPLQKERLFFHFPWQELFLNIQVPKPSRNWTNFSICLDLDSNWPRNLVLNKDVFQLFATPIINIRQGMAQPVICSGMQERYAIRNTDLENGFELHSLLGVYEITKEGLSPVRPGILSGAAPSYETEELRDSQGKKHHYLNLHFPQAFQEPRTVTSDALWIQPWFSETISQRLTVSPFSRSTVGLKWELLVNPVPHAEDLFQDNMDGFLHFLTLTNRATLNRHELLDILQAMGIMRQATFQRLCELLVDVRVEKAMQQGIDFSGMLRHRYILSFREYDSSLEPLMEIFLAHVENILDAWISGAKIEVRKEIAGSEAGASKGKEAK